MNAKPGRDTEGYLINPEQWDESVAHALAAEEGIKLSPMYWPILNFMHDYWLEHRVAPDVRHVVGFLTKEQGFKKKDAKQHLFKLFHTAMLSRHVRSQECSVRGHGVQADGEPFFGFQLSRWEH